MEFFEFLTVVIVLLGVPTVVFSGIKGIIAAKARENESSGGSTLRASELRAMVEAAVEDATEPLEERIRLLEEELSTGEGRIDPSVLAEAFDEPEEVEAPRPRRRQRAR